MNGRNPMPSEKPDKDTNTASQQPDWYFEGGHTFAQGLRKTLIRAVERRVEMPVERRFTLLTSVLTG